MFAHPWFSYNNAVQMTAERDAHAAELAALRAELAGLKTNSGAQADELAKALADLAARDKDLADLQVGGRPRGKGHRLVGYLSSKLHE